MHELRHLAPWETDPDIGMSFLEYHGLENLVEDGDMLRVTTDTGDQVEIPIHAVRYVLDGPNYKKR